MSSQGPPVSAVVYVAAGRWAQHRSSVTVVTVHRVRRRLQIFRLTYLLTYLLTYIALFRASSLPVLPIPLRQHSSVINLHANEIPFLLAVFNFERYQRQTYRKMYMFSMAPIRNSVPRGRSKKKTGGLYIGEDFLGMRLWVSYVRQKTKRQKVKRQNAEGRT